MLRACQPGEARVNVVDQTLLGAVAPASYRLQVSEAAADPVWDAFVARTPGGHHVQTSLWGQVKAAQGWKAVRLVATCGPEVVGGGQLLIRPASILGAAAYVTKGPLCASGDPELLALIVDALEQVCRACRVQYLIVQPPNNGEGMAAYLAGRGFRPTTVEVAPTATLLIDLSLSLDELLAQMHRQHRQNIRRSEREGIAVREGDETDLDAFYRLHLATSERQQFEPFSWAYFVRMWEVLRPHRAIALLLSEYQGEAISALLLVPFGDTVIAKVSGWSGQHGSRRPNEAVFWGAIRWAKERGFRYFDLEGIDPAAAHAILDGQPIAEELYHSPTFFKLMFGGQVALYPVAYDYVFNPLLRWAYRVVSPALQRGSVLHKVAERLRKRQVAPG